MAKVLVADDEEGYRRQLAITLSADGHELEAVPDGRQAIDIGARCRPDLLVTDWMLKDDIHGVHVAQVLRAVHPRVRVILITGFPSDDLRADARKAGITDFIEKPFDLDRISTAVREAMASRAGPRGPGGMGVLAVDSGGVILSANAAAGGLLAQTAGGGEAAALAEVFGPGALPDLDAAIDHWVRASPRADPPVVWRLRSQRPGAQGSRLVVLHRDEVRLQVASTLIDMLLGFKEPAQTRWPFEGRILLIDDEALVRGVFVSTLESCGAGCYAVATAAEGQRLLQHDQGLRFVLHDFDLPGCDTAASVATIRAMRPQVVIVGTSGAVRREEFAALGIDHYLQKPWRVSDLINVLAGRIGNCVDCALPLPLRRPKPGEQAGRWVCAYCGSYYRGVLDRSLPPDVLRNVRAVDSD